MVTSDLLPSTPIKITSFTTHQSPPAFILTSLDSPMLKADININSLWGCFPIEFIVEFHVRWNVTQFIKLSLIMTVHM